MDCFIGVAGQQGTCSFSHSACGGKCCHVNAVKASVPLSTFQLPKCLRCASLWIGFEFVRGAIAFVAVTKKNRVSGEGNVQGGWTF